MSQANQESDARGCFWLGDLCDVRRIVAVNAHRQHSLVVRDAFGHHLDACGCDEAVK